MNPARENILRRVRAALRIETLCPPAPSDSAVFPPVTNLEARFREEFLAVKGEIIGDLQQFKASVTEYGETGCDCLVAQTGSIFVSTRSAGGRALSIWPPVHLVIARRDQIVPDLPAAFALLRDRYGGRWPSALCLITGPSRTSDIEKTLVLGAHGPKRLAVFFSQ